MQGMYRNNNSILDEIKESFKQGSYLTKLIYINLGVFVFLGLNLVILRLTGSSNASLFYLGNWINLPSYLPELAIRPWSVITYMFVHELTYPGGLMHILFNLLVLFWFGRIFLMYLDQKKLLSIYLLGGMSGALLFILAYNFIPFFVENGLGATNRGASGAVMAVVFAISFYRPNFVVNLLFIGPVKLKYIAFTYVIMDVLGIAGTNAGGSFAHLGGALYGYLYISQYKKGRAIMKWFDRLLDGLFTLFKPRKKIRITYKNQPPRDDYEYNAQKVAKQEEIDKILEKISKYGYDSLNKKEKDLLFREGNRK